MSAPPLHPDIRAVVQAVDIQSPTRFALRGAVRDLTRMEVVTPSGGSREQPAEPLVRALEAELYQGFYCRPRPGGPAAGADPAEASGFIAALSRANRGRGAWEGGWVVAGVEPDGQVAVRKDGVTFWAGPAQVRTRTGAPSAAPSPGEACSVQLAKELRHLFPAYYMALGNRLPEAGPLLRLYWNLSPAAAIPYVRMVTELLNREEIPFKAKVLSHPRQYRRADAGVLYVHRTDFGRLRPILRQLYRGLGSRLHREVPMFTKPLAPGLGLAEDPGGGLSFGQSRCRVVAEGLYRCQAEGAADLDARLRVVAGVMRERGLDPLRPWLEPGSADDYARGLSP
ncbi:hypothetical protein J2Z79_002974 [Symbiobacterium terraclitae]|uniref:Uncharacterized protein n=1 Tax=Symbiobacterium terraclitae TaxID=557451 RepID=A0ABS4JVF1_9FIRM|nr:T3SS effector HopA1 family protein [Symbiobacterium terraclitae]MBP2019532.1 hypothetical protein [Symbiobacterium terraclitae]